MTATSVRRELKQLADPKRAQHLLRFFKTGIGEYGEGDRFLGVTVPIQRKVAKQFRALPLPEVEKLLQSGIHEHRLTALFIMVDQFKRGDAKHQKRVTSLFKKNLRFVNNWDLVDISAPNILGVYLRDKPKGVLYTYAKSPNLWRRRVSMLATLGFIREGDYKDAIAIAKILLYDEEDLIRKAVGWMLREVGSRDKAVEVAFLDKYHKTMPRTTLRYAIEKFSKRERTHYMKK